MALDWLKSGLLARRGYQKAIDQLQTQLEKRRNDPRLKLQLAELMIQAKRTSEAVSLLEAVADDFALQGYAARAIAILKRIRALDPEHAPAEEKLAYLISQEDNPAPSPWRPKREARPVEIGMEEIVEDGGIGMERIDTPSEIGLATGLDLDDESVRHEFLALIDLAFTPAEPAAASSDASVSPGLTASPLFSDFRPDELMAVIRGLTLSSYEPGDVIVSQGEPGDSLFVVAAGRARAFLKDKSGKNVPVRELGEGDFFGEIALMTGGPRSATIIARTRCELLELNRPELDRAAKAHPRVREVLQKFYSERVNTSI